MHETPRQASGTRSSNSELKETPSHQQRFLKLALLAGAQPFGSPHSGHVS